MAGQQRRNVTTRRVDAALSLLGDVLDEYQLDGRQRDDISRVRYLLDTITEGTLRREDGTR